MHNPITNKLLTSVSNEKKSAKVYWQVTVVGSQDALAAVLKRNIIAPADVMKLTTVIAIFGASAKIFNASLSTKVVEPLNLFLLANASIPCSSR